jgi:hypothetical protein
MAIDFTASDCPPVGTEYTIYKSTDHGFTFPTHSCPSQANADGSGLFGTGKPIVDYATDTIYQPALEQDANGTTTGVGVERSTDGGQTWTGVKISSVKHFYGFFPSPVAEDRAGNLYMVWGEAKDDNAKIGVAVRYSYSTDGGAHWSAVRDIARAGVNIPGSPVWPWAVAGSDGTLAVAWYQSDQTADVDTTKTNVSIYAARVTNADTSSPTVGITPATGVIHRGEICQSGTLCVASGRDRRLGDYLTAWIDLAGTLWIAYSDTVHFPDSPVSRPGLVHQVSGPSFLR